MKPRSRNGILSEILANALTSSAILEKINAPHGDLDPVIAALDATAKQLATMLSPQPEQRA